MFSKERVLWILAAAAALTAGLFAGSLGQRPESSNADREAAHRSGNGQQLNGVVDSVGSIDFVPADSTRAEAGALFPASRSPSDIATFTRKTLQEPNVLKRMAAYTNLLANMTPENHQAIEEAFGAETKEHGRLHYHEWTMYLERAGEVVGKPFLDRLYAEDRLDAARMAVTGWAISDPKAAVDWLETVPESDFRDRIWGASVRGIATSDPDLALRLLDQLPADLRKVYTKDLTSIMVQTIGVQGASDAFDEAVQRAETNEELDAIYLKRIFNPLVDRRLKRANLPGAENWARKHLGKPYADDNFYTTSAKAIARDSPEAAIQWLDDAAEAGLEKTDGFNGMVWAWIDEHGDDAVGNWLNENPDHRHRDRIASKFAVQIKNTDPEAALVWLETIQDPGLRAEALTQLEKKGAVEVDPFAPL